MLTLLKGPSYILDSGERVNNLVEGGRLCPRLVILILLKESSYILGSEERVNNFIKGGRPR
jgi:hypothetical protein